MQVHAIITKKKTTSYFVRLRKILWTKTSADKNSPRKHTFNSQASLVMGKLPFHGICALETVVFLKKVKWCDAFNKIQLDNLFPLEVEKFNIKKVCYWLSLLSCFCLHSKIKTLKKLGLHIPMIKSTHLQ